jgi:hypothetical protein
MPGSLLTLVLGWLATHLVALSLLGFLLVWLYLSGTVQLPGIGLSSPPAEVSAPRPQVDAPTSANASQATARTPPAEDAAAGSDVVAAERQPVFSAAPPERSAASERRAPTMIGGTIPIYGKATAPGAPGAFRPTNDVEQPPGSPPTYADGIQVAREAFWDGDFESAERAYIRVVERFPDDPDVFGELGNLYLAMGRKDLAMDAFFESGLRLRARGERSRLGEVADLLTAQGDGRGRLLLQSQ